MWRGDLVSKVPIRFRFELIHHDAEYAAAALVRTATRCFHHTQITAGTDSETGISEKLPNAACLFIFRIKLSAFGAAKDSDDSLWNFVSHDSGPGDGSACYCEPVFTGTAGVSPAFVECHVVETIKIQPSLE